MGGFREDGFGSDDGTVPGPKEPLAAFVVPLAAIEQRNNGPRVEEQVTGHFEVT